MEEDGLSDRYKLIILGGSAGSLEAILQIIGFARPNGPAIIIVIHRKWAQDSALVEILSNKTALPVKEVEEKDPILPGSVYVAPADYHLLIENDRTLSLDDSEKVNFSRPSIDVSFESVAEVYGNSAVAVLLSGGSSDGVIGLQRIKARGGLTIVQDPDTAQVEFMPRQAIGSVEIDQLLHAAEIGPFLRELS